MLRICYSQNENQSSDGRYAANWRGHGCKSCVPAGSTAAERGQLAAVVDLSDVTFIDESGERLLSEMRSAGVEFVAAGVETKHLLENLKGKGERPLRRFIGPIDTLRKPE